VDALDFLFRRLVLSVQKADALARPLDLGEVLERLVPYQSARRDGLLESNDDYLHAVMRLVAGERGLVFADELLQDDLKAELASPNPDLTLLRTYLNTKVRLATAHVERVLAGDTEIDLRPPTPARASAPVTTRPSTDASPRASVAWPDLTATAAAPAGGAFQASTLPSTTGTVRSGCPYCDQALPEGRPVKYCPGCGLNLLVRRCSGCSAEIESGWKFCVTCGRSAT
jgi:Double zinc ribbon